MVQHHLNQTFHLMVIQLDVKVEIAVTGDV